MKESESAFGAWGALWCVLLSQLGVGCGRLGYEQMDITENQPLVATSASFDDFTSVTDDFDSLSDAGSDIARPVNVVPGPTTEPPEGQTSQPAPPASAVSPAPTAPSSDAAGSGGAGGSGAGDGQPGAGGSGWGASAGGAGGLGEPSAADGGAAGAGGIPVPPSSAQGGAGTAGTGAAGAAGQGGAEPAPVDTGNDAGACTLLGSEVQVAQFTQPGVGGIAVDGAGSLTWTGETGNPGLGALEFDNPAGGSSRLTHTTSGDFSNRVLLVNVLVESGSDVELQLYAESSGWGTPTAYGEALTPEPGSWYCLRLNVSGPDAADASFDPSAVRLLGLLVQGTGSIRVVADQVAY